MRSLDTINDIPDLVRISQPELISERTFFWFTEEANKQTHKHKQTREQANKQMSERANKLAS